MFVPVGYFLYLIISYFIALFWGEEGVFFIFRPVSLAQLSQTLYLITCKTEFGKKKPIEFSEKGSKLQHLVKI